MVSGYLKYFKHDEFLQKKNSRRLEGGSFLVHIGADIKEMKDLVFANVYAGNFLSQWDRVTRLTKPTIAAVNGFAVRRFLKFGFSLWLFVSELN